MTIPSVSAYLTRLLTIVFLPLAVFATGILVWGAQQQREQADSRLVDSAIALALVIDQQLSAKSAALITLAQSGSMREGDLARFYDFAKRVANQQGSSIVMWDPSGQQIINTRVPFGTVLPIGTGAANVISVVATRKASVSDLFTGAVARKPIVSLYTPVFGDKGVDYVLSIGTNAEDIGTLLMQYRMPEGWVAAVVDAKGIIIARSANGEAAVGRSAEPWFVDGVRDRTQGLVEGDSRDGFRIRNGFARMSSAPWTVAVGLPANGSAVARTGPLALFVIGGVLLFIALLFVAGRQAKRLAQAIDVAPMMGAHALQAHAASALTFKRSRTALDRYSIAALAVALSILVRSILDPLVGNTLVFGTLYPAIALAVWYGGFGPGIFATLSGYAAANYFFIEPRFTWSLGVPLEVTALVLFLSSSLLIVWMGHRMRNAELAEAHRAAQAESGNTLLRTLLDNAPMGITIVGGPPDYPVIANSKTAVELIGKPAAALNGMPAGDHAAAFGLHRLDGGCVPPQETSLYRATHNGERTIDHEVMIVRPDGKELVVSIAAAPIEDSTGSIVGAISCWFDISARKAMEAQLREADTRKDTFLATLAHELRNPLAAIRNAFEFMNQQSRQDAPAQRVRDIATRQVGQLTRLVDDLLDVSRITLGKIELNRAPVSIIEVLNDAVESVRAVFTKGQQTLTMNVVGEAWVDGDRERLTQVITNILTNSAKYTPAGGHIDITSSADEGMVTITVRDDGIGISPEFLPRIFDPFQQANPVSSMPEGGLGIGLTLVKELIAMHGGTVEAMSAGSNQGSVFTVRLPRVAAPVENEEASDAAVTTEPAGAARSVIVVDDNRDAAETTAMVLRLMGHAVRTAHDGTEALELARNLPPDAMIVDLGMPGMSGYDVAREVRATSALSGVLLIAVTGWGEDAYRQETAAAGFAHHLVKPADPMLLHSLIAATSGNPAASAAA